jgi:hypothetical protein
MRCAVLFLCLALTGGAAAASEELIANGGFESGLAGWRPLWSRQAGTGTVTLDGRTVHSGTKSARIEHRGAEDWSFEPDLRLAVQSGDIFELEAWVHVEGAGSVSLCASTWDASGQNISWSSGERIAQAGAGWTRLHTRLAISQQVARLQPRLIGYGPVTVWVDDYSVVKRASAESYRRKELPKELVLSNAVLSVSLNVPEATLSVLDRRTSRLWRQQPTDADTIITDASAGTNQFNITLVHVPSGLELTGTVKLDAARPEFTLEVAGKGTLAEPLRFPYPFGSEPGDRLIVPLNEGIAYPAEDKSIEPFRLIAYGGHGICMAFWGVTDDAQGQAAIIETPDDAAIRSHQIDGRLAIAPEWDPQRGQFAYARRLRYIFFDHGGHVAIAKRYREYSRQAGRLRTLAEKRRVNPNVDLLVGAVNVWHWTGDPVAMVKEMQAAGIKRILWSSGGSPAALRNLNQMKVLTGRYDIYQDVMDPANFPRLKGIHGDWPTAAWPADIILRANGQWQHGWGIKGRAGEWYFCGVLCDSRALAYARERIPAELATHPYECRFIDTTTAAPWNECYHTNHPMTRTESREWKMKLLGFVSDEMKLVTGSETGHDAAVPFVDYFEGMLSLGLYRVPDAGRDMQRIWTEVPERVAKFQLGHQYRLPLWELVYHDCVVAQWYWGDYNNKLPALWDKRDLFNVLYGTPPMFMFDRGLWEREKERFVQSYQNTCPNARATGYSEMTEHRFLDAQRDVQQTKFANGVTVTVNFGEKPYSLSAGQVLKPLGFTVTGTPVTTD